MPPSPICAVTSSGPSSVSYSPVNQLTWSFTDMSDAGGKMTIMWDKKAASVPFKLQ
jgi:hypothetical protein